VTMPPLPAKGSTAWYEWAQAAHAAAAAVPGKADLVGGAVPDGQLPARLSDPALRAAFGRVAQRTSALSAQGAVTISWDDGYERIMRNLYPMLRDEFPNQRHTFGIVSSFLGTTNFVTAADVRTLHAAGHEIASHSHTHPTLTSATVAQRVTEYDQSKTDLEALIGAPVDTFIIPIGNNGRSATTDQEVYGRYARLVNAGVSWGGSMVPLDARRGLFLIPRPPVWDSSTHQTVLALIRQAATMPVVLNLYAHRPGDGPTGGSSGGGVADMTLAELREGLRLIEDLGLPVVNLRDAYPGQPILANPGAESGTGGWLPVISGIGKTFGVVADTPVTGLPGTKSFHLTSTDVGGFVYAYQDVPVRPGETYVFSGRCRKVNTTTAGTATIRAQFRDQFGTGVGGVTSASNGTADGTWGRVETAALTAPATAAVLRVDMALISHVGEMYVDHLCLTQQAHGSFG
jgi:peptidoglycan/xylan/chitin deacetylase (PgdA/CDA1 family)